MRGSTARAQSISLEKNGKDLGIESRSSDLIDHFCSQSPTVQRLRRVLSGDAAARAELGGDLQLLVAAEQSAHVCTRTRRVL
jgi:hypothetical protein